MFWLIIAAFATVTALVVVFKAIRATRYVVMAEDWDDWDDLEDWSDEDEFRDFVAQSYPEESG